MRLHEIVPLQGAIMARDLADAAQADECFLGKGFVRSIVPTKDQVTNHAPDKVRIMRVLTNRLVFCQPKPGYYAHNAMSSALCNPDLCDLMAHRYIPDPMCRRSACTSPYPISADLYITGWICTSARQADNRVPRPKLGIVSLEQAMRLDSMLHLTRRKPSGSICVMKRLVIDLNGP